MRAREARLWAILNHTSDGIVTIDEGRIDTFNRAAERMFGYWAAEVLGEDIWSLMSMPDAEVEPLSAAQDRASGFSCEMIGRRKDGSTFPLEVSLSEGRVGDRRLVTALLRDISERKRHEAERRAAAEALREAKEAAERASVAKTEFLANMSHEIRTPLNAIIGIADILSEARLDEELRQYVDMFRRAGSNLLALVNDILDLSKIEAHKVTLETIPFDLRDVVAQAMEATAVRAHEKGLELVGHVVHEVPGGLAGDPTRVRQVLVNLLGNAVKFTAQGEVTLHVERYPGSHDPGMLLFSVSDTGIGIPEHKLEAVFERFSQLDSSTTRTHGGTGLGLAICRRLVSLMGGRIWAEKRPGGGTTVRFTARFALARPPETTSRMPLLLAMGRRALVIDDHAGTCAVAKEVLREPGCDVTTATSAAEARAILEEAQRAGRGFDLVLVDAHMPRSDGFDIVAWLSAHAELAARCILTVPTDTRASELTAARDAGFAGHVLKPLTPGRLGAAFVMQRQAAAPRDRAAERTALSRQEGRKILLVEDHADNRAVVLAYLKKTPHEVLLADNGQDAVRMVREHRFDLVLMDMQMPVMDGYEATRRIRAWERETGRRPMPIVAFTAQAMKEESEQARAAGCDGHLIKPLRKPALLDAIAEYTARPPR